MCLNLAVQGKKRKKKEKKKLDHFGPTTQREFKTIVSRFVFSITGLKQLAQISTALVPPPCKSIFLSKTPPPPPPPPPFYGAQN